MIRITATEICQASGGELLRGSSAEAVSCVSTDTRGDLSGCLFVALKGDNFDGGDFAEEALAQGAAGVLAERAAAARIAGELAAVDDDGEVPLVVAVDNAGQALKRIASLVAGKSRARVVAITGSTGKTSTKDMLYTLVSPRLNTVASRASFNNEVGVPLTLLGLKTDTRVAVVEMGMQAPGEIGELCRIVPPDIAVITNIGPAHLQYAGSLQNIARGKAEIARELPPDGGLVIPFGETLLDPYLGDVDARIVTFGFDAGADIHPVSHRHREDGGLHCRLSCLGEEVTVDFAFAAHHHLLNFMAALGAYRLLGLPLAQVVDAARDIRLSGLRGELIELDNGVTLLNDCYNANPLSMASSLDYLVSVAPGRRTVAILGDMGELGGDSLEYHRQVGRKAAELGVDCIVGVGELAAGYIEGARGDGGCDKKSACVHFPDRAVALTGVCGLILPGDVVLVKASRFMRLEAVSNAIADACGTPDAGAASTES
ncbi:MAG: UDP-N-acetylmuramoyl-tripeptide--D-alanyl-D-alanine ligase [Thermoleophilia bacterium]